MPDSNTLLVYCLVGGVLALLMLYVVIRMAVKHGTAHLTQMAQTLAGIAAQNKSKEEVEEATGRFNEV
jgi:hypothetical protein